jgi:hypothetical protein
MPSYAGFLRGTEDAIPAADAERALQAYLDWSASLANPPSGSALSRKGRTLRRDGVVTATNGPFVEGTEILGGYIVIEAADLDEAEKIFGSHPHLEFGSIEIRKLGELGCED